MPCQIMRHVTATASKPIDVCNINCPQNEYADFQSKHSDDRENNYFNPKMLLWIDEDYKLSMHTGVSGVTP